MMKKDNKNLQGMLMDNGILPVDATSSVSRTSNNCMSPSTSISFKHSKWISPGASFEQFQMRSLGPALAEKARTSEKYLWENADVANFPTWRKAISRKLCSWTSQVIKWLNASRSALIIFICSHWHTSWRLHHAFETLTWRHCRRNLTVSSFQAYNSTFFVLLLLTANVVKLRVWWFHISFYKLSRYWILTKCNAIVTRK